VLKRSIAPLPRILSLGAVLLIARIACAQVDPVAEARSAMAGGDYARAAALLTATISQRPSADAYVYLGVALAHTREWKRAEDTLLEGAGRYPQDPRFHNELAGVYIAANDLDRARASLGRTLVIDPDNKYATDLLATIDMSTGNAKAALDGWNKDGRPIVGDILHNSHLDFENWFVRRAVAFREGDMLTFGQWRTTEARLRETSVFSTVNIDIEPTPDPDRYNAVIRTVAKSNGIQQLAVPFLEAAIFKHPSVDWWNIRDTGVSLTAAYRFSTNRHRASLRIRSPLPAPHLLFLEAEGLFRSERWDISRPAKDTGFDSRFLFQSTGLRARVRHIPQYRVVLDAGFEYRNRTAHGVQPGIGLDSRNSAKLLFGTSYLLADGRYRSRIRGDGFVARKKLFGDLDFSGGTLEWNNRYAFEGRTDVGLEVTLKGGATEGEVPIDEYFVMGTEQRSSNLLRGHRSVSSRGHYGHSPMGTSFALFNTTVDRRLMRVPFFNVLNEPYLELRWQVFVDGGKTFDRARVFEQGKFLVDIGAGFKIETQTRSFNLTYGRSLRDGTGALGAYVQQRW